MRAISWGRTVAIAAATVLLASCSGTPVRLGSADQYAGPIDTHASTGRPVKASANGFQLLLFIPININDRHERAFQLLRAQAGNDYLTNIAIEESWTWAFVGTVYKTTLSGIAYRRATESARPAQQAAPGTVVPGMTPSQMCDLPSLVDKAECLGRLRPGMSRALVINILGPPSETLGSGDVVRYDDRYLQFDDTDQLTGITDIRPQ